MGPQRKADKADEVSSSGHKVSKAHGTTNTQKGTTRLTATAIDALSPRKSRYEVTDPGCSGLQLRVEPSGFKSWLFRYYWLNKRVKLSLGPLDRVSLARARELTVQSRTMLDRGIDPRRAGIVNRATKSSPIAERSSHAVPAEHSIDQLAAEFMRLHVTPRRRRPEYVQRIVDADILPQWKGRDARSIKPREVIELLDGITARGSKVMANRIAGLLKQMFLFGVHRQIVEASPVQLLYQPGGKEKPRERAFSKAELKAFLQHHEECCRSSRMAHVLMILLLTAQRRGELALARWTDIDFDVKTWLIPDEHAKAGRGHVVPLSDWAITEFKALKKLARRSRYVFPTDNDAQPAEAKLITRSVARCLEAFKREGVDAFTPHDLRRTCRTGLARLKIEPHIAERVLNHAQERIPGTYDVHDYMDEKRDALDKWAAYLHTLLNDGGRHAKA